MGSFIVSTGRRWFASIFISQGLTLFDKEQLEYAKAHFQRALRIAPGHPKAHYHLAQVLSKQGRDAEAVRELTEALRSKPRYPAALMARGLSYCELGQLAEAAADCERAVELKRSYEHLTALGAVYSAARRYDDAERVLQEAARLKPKELSAFLEIGELYFAQQRYEEARTMFSRAAEIDPKSGPAFAALGRTAEKLGDLREALKHYTRAGFLQPKNAQLRCDSARIAELEGDEAGAVISYQEALRIDPEAADGLLWLCRFYRKAGDFEKARPYAERLAGAHGERWEGKYELAVCLARLGAEHEREALDALKQAMAIDAAAVKQAADPNDFSELKSGYKFRELIAA